MLQLLGGEYADICAQGACRHEAAVTGVCITHVTLNRANTQHPCLDRLHVLMWKVLHVCVHLLYICVYTETWATTASALWLPSLSATWPNWQRCKWFLSLADIYLHMLLNSPCFKMMHLVRLFSLFSVSNIFQFVDIFWGISSKIPIKKICNLYIWKATTASGRLVIGFCGLWPSFYVILCTAIIITLFLLCLGP